MSSRPPFRRLGLVPASTPGDPLRRYRLARLEHVAMATREGGSPDDPPHAVANQPIDATTDAATTSDQSS
jgi:hypothetical protein